MFGRNVPILDIELDEEYLATILMKHATDWQETLNFLENLALSRGQLFSTDTVSNIIRAEYEKE